MPTPTNRTPVRVARVLTLISTPLSLTSRKGRFATQLTKINYM